MEHLPAADLGLTVTQETNIEKIIKCIICNFKLFIPLLLYIIFYWPFDLLQTFLNIIFFYCNARNSRGSCQFSHIKNLPHLPYSIPSPYHVNVIKYDLSAANRWCSHNSLFIPRNTKKYLWKISLHEKCPFSEFFWSLFSRIWPEYADFISPYSVRIQEKTDHKNSEYEQFFRRKLRV